MRLLLDTHLLLWAAIDKGLSPAATAMIEDPANTLFFSVASIWEVAIKAGLGRHNLLIGPDPLRRALLSEGYQEIPISGAHAIAVTNLPALHHDPFDRLLVAQAISEGVTLITVDQAILQYPGPIRSAA